MSKRSRRGGGNKNDMANSSIREIRIEDEWEALKVYEQTIDRKDQNRAVASPHSICEDTAAEGRERQGSMNIVVEDVRSTVVGPTVLEMYSK